jgi:hypothetical protein
MGKQIRNVTHEGIDYLDEQGNPQWVDFQHCYDNWFHHQSLRTDPDYDERNKEIARTWKCVGQRNICGTPPYIEFFTDPVTRFEFNSPDKGFHELRYRVHKTGWRTSDMT